MAVMLFGLGKSHFFSGREEKGGPRLTFVEVLLHVIHSVQGFSFAPHNSSVRKTS